MKTMYKSCAAALALMCAGGSAQAALQPADPSDISCSSTWVIDGNYLPSGVELGMCSIACTCYGTATSYFLSNGYGSSEKETPQGSCTNYLGWALNNNNFPGGTPWCVPSAPVVL